MATLTQHHFQRPTVYNIFRTLLSFWTQNSQNKKSINASVSLVYGQAVDHSDPSLYAGTAVGIHYRCQSSLAAIVPRPNGHSVDFCVETLAHAIISFFPRSAQTIRSADIVERAGAICPAPCVGYFFPSSLVSLRREAIPIENVFSDTTGILSISVCALDPSCKLRPGKISLKCFLNKTNRGWHHIVRLSYDRVEMITNMNWGYDPNCCWYTNVSDRQE